MEWAMQLISNDKIVGSNTVKDSKDVNSQSSTTQAEKGEQLLLMMPANKKSFGLMGDDIVKLLTENIFMTKKIGSYDE